MTRGATRFVAAAGAAGALVWACSANEGVVARMADVSDAGPASSIDVASDPNGCARCMHTLDELCAAGPDACPPNLDSPDFSAWFDRRVIANPYTANVSCEAMPDCPEQVILVMGTGMDTATWISFDTTTKKVVAAGAAIHSRCGSANGCLPNRCAYDWGVKRIAMPAGCPAIEYGGGSWCPPRVLANPTQPNPAYRPPRVEAACTSAQLSDFYDTCIGANATATTCRAWETANASCDACAIGTPNQATWSAIVPLSSRMFVYNTAGCLAVALGEEASTSGCGAAHWALDVCVANACDPANCAADPMNPSDVERAGLDECKRQAISRTGPCRDAVTDVNARCGALAGGAASPLARCPVTSFATPTRDQILTQLATQCGGAVTDAGAD